MILTLFNKYLVVLLVIGLNISQKKSIQFKCFPMLRGYVTSIYLIFCSGEDDNQTAVN